MMPRTKLQKYCRLRIFTTQIYNYMWPIKFLFHFLIQQILSIIQIMELRGSRYHLQKMHVHQQQTGHKGKSANRTLYESFKLLQFIETQKEASSPTTASLIDFSHRCIHSALCTGSFYNIVQYLFLSSAKKIRKSTKRQQNECLFFFILRRLQCKML